MDSVSQLFFSLGWVGSFICMLYTLRLKALFANDDINLKFPLNMFAASWGILVFYFLIIGNFDVDQHTAFDLYREFLPALNGFLLGNVGLFCYREAHGTESRKIKLLDSAYPFLLIGIFVPHVISIPGIQVNNESIHFYVCLIIVFICRVIGFILLKRGMKTLASTSGAGLIFNVSIYFYLLFEVLFVVQKFFTSGTTSSDLYNAIIIGFSFCKITLTITFLHLILRNNTRYINYSVMEVLLAMFHIAHLPEERAEIDPSVNRLDKPSKDGK